MKLLVGLTFLFSMNFASAAEITGGELSYDNKYLILNTVHGGGCGSHEFSLSRVSCSRSLPPKCITKLEHKTDDVCEALISSTIVFDLEKERLANSMAGTRISVMGDLESSVTVTFKGKR